MKPVIMLIPGMLNDARIWTDVVTGLASDTDVRVADILTQSSIADMRRDTWQLVEDVPTQAPLVLVGFSMGGYVAIDMLAHAPRPLTGLVLLSSSGRIESAEGLVAREKSLQTMQGDFDKFVEGVLKWSTHSATDELKQRLRTMMLEIGSDTAQRQVKAIMARKNHRELLNTLQMPVQILCGQHDRVTPLALSQELAQWIPGARQQWIDNAGHMMPCEQPEVLVRAIKDFLASAIITRRPT